MSYIQERFTSLPHIIAVALVCGTVGFSIGRIPWANTNMVQNTKVIPVSRLGLTLAAPVAYGASMPSIAAAERIPAEQIPAAAPSLLASLSESVISNAGSNQTYAYLAGILAVTGLVAYAIASSREEATSPMEFGGGKVKLSPSGMFMVDGKVVSSPDGWKVQSELLKRRGTKTVSGVELKNAVASKKVTVVDVRPVKKFMQAAIPGSINVPLFQPITGWSAFKIARRTQFAVFAMEGTEFNPDFISRLKAKVGGIRGELVFVDDSNIGTLESTVRFPDGKPGHALISAYLASIVGINNKMGYLEGGFAEYCQADGDLVVPDSTE